MLIKRKPVKLELGKNYLVWYNTNHQMVCKFIQPTKRGFNFLNSHTNRCILPHHLYPSKFKIYDFGDCFWVNEKLKIQEIP